MTKRRRQRVCSNIMIFITFSRCVGTVGIRNNRVFLHARFRSLFAALLVVCALKFTVTARSSIRVCSEKCEIGFAKTL